jgi:6,7-dimethyl-8-ribityllumazine synthase
MYKYTGRLHCATNQRFAIVASRFNETIVKQLVSGAEEALLMHGVNAENISLAWVPGAFELPLVAQRLAQSEDIDAVICLGCIIQGATPHFDCVMNQCASGVLQSSLKTEKPILFGVLTTNSIEEALERSGTKMGNKGYEVTVSAIEMLDLMQQLPETKKKEKIRV